MGGCMKLHGVSGCASTLWAIACAMALFAAEAQAEAGFVLRRSDRLAASPLSSILGFGADPYVDADRVLTVPVVLPPLGAPFIRVPVYVLQVDAAGRTLVLGADFADPPLHPRTRVELSSVTSPEIVSLGGGDLVFGGAELIPVVGGYRADPALFRLDPGGAGLTRLARASTWPGGEAAFPVGHGHLAVLPDGRFATVGDSDGRLYAGSPIGVVLAEGAAVPRLEGGPGPCIVVRVAEVVATPPDAWLAVARLDCPEGPMWAAVRSAPDADPPFGVLTAADAPPDGPSGHVSLSADGRAFLDLGSRNEVLDTASGLVIDVTAVAGEVFPGEPGVVDLYSRQYPVGDDGPGVMQVRTLRNDGQPHAALYSMTSPPVRLLAAGDPLPDGRVARQFTWATRLSDGTHLIFATSTPIVDEGVRLGATDTGVGVYLWRPDAPLIALLSPVQADALPSGTPITWRHYLPPTRADAAQSDVVCFIAQEVDLGVNKGEGLYCVTAGEGFGVGGGPGTPLAPPADLPSAEHGVRLRGLEVTQGLQTWRNEIDLIEGRETTVRAALEPADDYVVPFRAVLHGTRGGQPLPGSPLPPSRGDALVLDSLAVQANLGRVDIPAVEFDLPESWRSGEVLLTLEPAADETHPLGCVGHSGPLAESCQALVRFTPGPEMRVKLVATRWRNAAGPHVQDPATLPGLARGIAAMVPARALTTTVGQLDLGPVNQCNVMEAALPKIDLFRAADGCGVACSDFYLGVVPRPVCLYAGLAYLGRPAAATIDAPETAAHELGHNLGLEHAAYCGAVARRALEPVFEYPQPNGPVPIMGPATLDPDRQTWGYDLSMDRPISWNRAAEFMSYCRLPERWVSRTSRSRMLAALTAREAAARFSVSPFSAGPGLVVALSFDPAGTVASSAPLFTDLAEPPAEGPWRFELLDAVGQVLDASAFLHNEVAVEDPDAPAPDSSVVVAYPETPLARSWRVLDPDGRVAFVRRGSAHAPTLAVQSPAPGAMIDGEPLELAFAAADADGDALTVTVQVRGAVGETWSTIWHGPATSPLTLTRASLPAAPAATLRVQVTDGFFVAHADVEPLTLPPQAPIVDIVSPQPGSVVFAGDTVTARASVWDLDRGAAATARLRWFSDRDGDLGVDAGAGLRLTAAALSPGLHRLTVDVLDDAGAVARAEVAATDLDVRGDAPATIVDLGLTLDTPALAVEPGESQVIVGRIFNRAVYRAEVDAVDVGVSAQHTLARVRVDGVACPVNGATARCVALSIYEQQEVALEVEITAVAPGEGAITAQLTTAAADRTTGDHSASAIAWVIAPPAPPPEPDAGLPPPPDAASATPDAAVPQTPDAAVAPPTPDAAVPPPTPDAAAPPLGDARPLPVPDVAPPVADTTVADTAVADMAVPTDGAPPDLRASDAPHADAPLAAVDAQPRPEADVQTPGDADATPNILPESDTATAEAQDTRVARGQGCACRTVGGETAAPWLMLALTALGLANRRRRVSRRG